MSKVSIINIFKSTLSDIKRTPAIIGYSAIYAVFTAVFAVLKFTAYNLLITQGSLRNSFLSEKAIYALSVFMINSVSMLIFSSYVMMLIGKRFKFRRFFSLFHIKHIRYDLAVSAVIVLPITAAELLFRSAYSADNKYMTYLWAFSFLILDIFKDVFVCFGKKNIRQKFGTAFMNAILCIKNDLGGFALLEISFIPFCILILITDSLLGNAIASEDLEAMLSAVHYGLDIFLLPFYMLCLNEYISAENDGVIAQHQVNSIQEENHR